MKIIIEGCDGTGKTTLAKKLARKYGLDIVHMTGKDPKDFEFYKQSLRKTNVIYDRNFISEPIYAKVFNRKQALTKKQIEKLYKVCKKENVYIIMVDFDNITEINRRLCERGDEPIEVLHNLAYIVNAYQKTFDYIIENDEVNYVYTRNDKSIDAEFRKICKIIDLLEVNV